MNKAKQTKEEVEKTERDVSDRVNKLRNELGSVQKAANVAQGLPSSGFTRDRLTSLLRGPEVGFTA